MDTRPERKFDPALRQLVGNGAGIGDGTCQPIEFRDNERIALAHRSQSLSQPRTLAVGAGQAVIGVDAVPGHPKASQNFPLRRKILLVGRAAGIADAGFGHVRLPVLESAGIKSGCFGLCNTMGALTDTAIGPSK